MMLQKYYLVVLFAALTALAYADQPVILTLNESRRLITIQAKNRPIGIRIRDRDATPGKALPYSPSLRIIRELSLQPGESATITTGPRMVISIVYVGKNTMKDAAIYPKSCNFMYLPQKSRPTAILRT